MAQTWERVALRRAISGAPEFTFQHETLEELVNHQLFEKEGALNRFAPRFARPAVNGPVVDDGKPPCGSAIFSPKWAERNGRQAGVAPSMIG